jgi:hypothetical protein
LVSLRKSGVTGGWGRGTWRRPAGPLTSRTRVLWHYAWTERRRPASACEYGGVWQRMMWRTGATSCAWAFQCHFNFGLGWFDLIFLEIFELTKVCQDVYTKLVHLTTVYNFYKGS